MQHVDERLRAMADWLADAVDPSGALERVRRKKARRRIVRRAEATALAVVVLAATAGGVLVLARVFGLDTKPRPAAVLGDRSVAFVSDQDGDNEIYVIEGDGRPARLTDNDADDRAPAWSPDGTKIAFLRGEDGPFYVYVMNSEGTEARRVTQPGPGDVIAGQMSGETMWFSRLSWSADGSRITFGGRETGLPCPSEGCPYLDRDIFSVRIDGSDLVNLTDTTPADELDPAWAPDGETIVFVRAAHQEGETPAPVPEGIPQLYIMNTDASGVGRLTDLPASAIHPAWSPDGTRIAFEGDGDIYVMNADASGLRRLAILPPPDAGNAAPHPSYGNYEPSWSPDGMRIVFVSDRDGDRDLYVMEATGTEDQALRLTDSPEQEYQPAWEPSPTEGDATPSPLAPSSECPELVEAGDLPESYRSLGKPLGGDVTGDGTTDHLSILGNEDAPPRCQYFVAVEHQGGRTLAPITPIEWMPDVPSLLMGVEVDGEAGLELVVDFGGPMHPHRTGLIFSFDEGSLVQMRTERNEYGLSRLFPLHSESVGSVDCVGEPGAIVVTVGGFADGGNDDGHFDITRTFYRAEGAVFLETREEKYTVEVGMERERWPEVADDPFRSCRTRVD